MNPPPSHCRNPESVSRTEPQKSRPDGDLTAKLKRTRPGARWVRFLHRLDQKWKRSEREYHSLLVKPPLNLESLENLPNPLPISETLLNYWEKERRKGEEKQRSRVWERVKKKICPQLTPLEKKIFLRIIRTPKMQDWEIAGILNLTEGTIRWYRTQIERKLRREFESNKRLREIKENQV